MHLWSFPNAGRHSAGPLAVAALVSIAVTACGGSSARTASVVAHSARTATRQRTQIPATTSTNLAPHMTPTTTAAPVDTAPAAPPSTAPATTAATTPTPTSTTATAPVASTTPHGGGAPNSQARESCGSVAFAPASSYLASGIQASGGNCSAAMAVASASRSHQYDPPGAGQSVQDFTAQGFSCVGHLDAHSVLEMTDYTCTKGSTVVTFQRSG